VIAGLDEVFVHRPAHHTGEESLPDSGGAFRGEFIFLAVPTIELADDRDAFRIRRPYGEICPGHPLHFRRVRSEFAIQSEVRTFIEKVKIFFGQ
jgi:hypothetical protein